MPGVFPALRWACFAYLLWLAWLILRDAHPRPRLDEQAPSRSTVPSSRPLNCLEGMLFQLINPKAWMMAITVVTGVLWRFGAGPARPGTGTRHAHLPRHRRSQHAGLGPIWGASIDRVLHQPRARQLFSYAMAAMVVATAVWMLR